MPALVAFLGLHLVAKLLQRAQDLKAKGAGVVLEAMVKGAGKAFHLTFAAEMFELGMTCGLELSRIQRPDAKKELDALSQEHLSRAAIIMRQFLEMAIVAGLTAAAVEAARLGSTMYWRATGEPARSRCCRRRRAPGCGSGRRAGRGRHASPAGGLSKISRSVGKPRRRWRNTRRESLSARHTARRQGVPGGKRPATPAETKKPAEDKRGKPDEHRTAPETEPQEHSGEVEEPLPTSQGPVPK